MKQKPKVGQIIYSLNVGNSARGQKQKLTQIVVKKVGRKYFYAGPESWPDETSTKFEISTWCQVTEYMAGQKLYERVYDYDIDMERDKLTRNIESCFRHGIGRRLLMGQLREIDEIIRKYDG